MSIVVTSDSVNAYYEKVFSECLHNEQGLFDPPHPLFTELISAPPKRSDASGVELGYGCGNYSLEAAHLGYKMIAIDRIDQIIFKNRVEQCGFADRIDVRQMDLANFIPKDPFDLVISKDTLHFLERGTADRLISTLARLTKPSGRHYLTIFVDITRISDDDKPILIQGEANYSVDTFLEFLNRVYLNWKLEITIDSHEERSQRTGKIYFMAKRITICAQKAAEEGLTPGAYRWVSSEDLSAARQNRLPTHETSG